MKIKEKLELIKSGKLTPEENIKNFIEEIESNNQKGKNSVLISVE